MISKDVQKSIQDIWLQGTIALEIGECKDDGVDGCDEPTQTSRLARREWRRTSITTHHG
jgi:hypothetical protein